MHGWINGEKCYNIVSLIFIPKYIWKNEKILNIKLGYQAFFVSWQDTDKIDNFNHLKLYNLVLSTFNMLPNHHYCLVPEWLIAPKVDL